MTTTKLDALSDFFDEAAEVTEFTAAIGDESFTVTILDYGPSRPNGRYCAKVQRNDDDKCASGNPSESVFGALAGVYWRDVGLRWPGSGTVQPLGTPGS